MPRQCIECKVDLMNSQVSFDFRAVETGSDEWQSFPLLAEICPKCGKMESHVLTPTQLKEWLDSQKPKVRTAKA